MKTLQTIFVLMAIVLAQNSAVIAQTTNVANELKNSPGFKALDAARQRLAELFFAQAQKDLRQPGNFIDPVKYSVLAADEVVADLKAKNARAKERNFQTKESLAKLVTELKENGVTPDEAISLDSKKLDVWIKTHTNETANLPQTLKQKLHSVRMLDPWPEDETIETLLNPKRLANGKIVGGLNYSAYYNKGHLIAGAFDKQKAYNYAYADTEGSEEPYRKFYAKRFSELMEEGGGQTGSQIFIDIRTKISLEWEKQKPK